MKLLFITTLNTRSQGDYMELSLLHGLRSVLGDNCVDFPKKKILYGDFSDSPKDQLHGKGFTYCSSPIADISIDRAHIKSSDFDVVLMGSGHIYNETWKIDHPNIWYTDGHDLYGNAPRKIDYNGENIIGCQFTSKCFKRELVEEFDNVYPINFGIPKEKIMNFNIMPEQRYQSTAPSDACFRENSKYIFDNEDEYYQDMNVSSFGLTCKKGGWQSLRTMELLAAGCVVLYKDFDKKPYKCGHNFPTISYSYKEELHSIDRRLIIDNRRWSDEYRELRNKQREWLLANGTTEAIAQKVVNIIETSL